VTDGLTLAEIARRRADPFDGEPTEWCEHCEQEIPASRWRAHRNGLDAARLECPGQDLEAIVRRQRQDSGYGSWANFARDAHWR
jgi:hypothetical protein